MARSFLSQPTQVFNSELYDDTLTTGVTLQTNSVSLEGDLNSIRTQLRQILWANVSGSWYDAVTAPSGGLSARGLNTINVDLTDLEQKRFLFRSQSLNLVNVATGSTFAELSNSLGTAPSNFAAVNATFASGTVVALLSGTEGAFGTPSLAQVSGSTVITPKNLVIVRDAWTHYPLTASMTGQQIFGLLQAESGTLTGDAFNDVDRRTQISFVVEAMSNGTSSLTAAPAADIGGRTITYMYTRRTALDNIPEDAYLSDTIFADMAGFVSASSVVVFSDITLQNAINNQIGNVSQNKNINIVLGAGFSWAYLSGTKELWKVTSSDTEDLLTVNVDRIAMSSSFATTFQQGISVATSSVLSQVDIGLIAGTVNTLSGTQLVLSGGSTLGFSDFFGPSSTYSGGIIPLATGTIEWNRFVTGYGNSSILGAFYFLSQSLSASAQQRLRFTAGVTTTVNANTNVTFPTNLDAALGNYVAKNFLKEVNVFLNGQLLFPGATAGDPNDVYPGTAPASGDLRFPYKLRSGSIISMEIF